MKIKIIFFIITIFLNKNLLCESLFKNYTEIKSQLIPIKSKLKNKLLGNYKNNNSTNTNTSLNWCGYVAATNLKNPKSYSVESVFGTWNIPQLKSNKKESSCIIWVGMDGYKSNTIEQIGTAHELINGKQNNYAWFALHPNNSFQISNFPINVNDEVTAGVFFVGNNNFIIVLSNNTTKRFTILNLNSPFNNLRNTAQWIVEADSKNLAKFGTINFNDCKAVINNVEAKINHWQNTALTMVLSSNVAHNENKFNKNTARAVASNLSSSGKAFRVHSTHN